MLKEISGLPRRPLGVAFFFYWVHRTHKLISAKRGALIWEHYCGCSNGILSLKIQTILVAIDYALWYLFLSKYSFVRQEKYFFPEVLVVYKLSL